MAASRLTSRPVRVASPQYALLIRLLYTLTVYKSCSIVDGQSMGKPIDLVQGTLDLLILKTIALEPKHGWAIAKRIQQVTSEVLQVQQGSLYPALHRLEQQAWIKGHIAETE